MKKFIGFAILLTALSMALTVSLSIDNDRTANDTTYYSTDSVTTPQTTPTAVLKGAR